MRTVNLYCELLEGQNNTFTRTGDFTVSFIADVLRGYETETVKIIVHDVGESKFRSPDKHAYDYALYCYCGILANPRDFKIVEVSA